MKYTRREFIKQGAAGALTTAFLAGCAREKEMPRPDATTLAPPEPGPPLSPAPATPDAADWDGYGPPPIVGNSKGIPTRVLGKTGAAVTILGTGGGHIANNKDDDYCIALIRRAHELGVTYFDTAQNYGNGRSERLHGRALQGLDRASYFLTMKIYTRDYATAARHIRESFERLQVESVDCIMIHGVDDRATTELALSEAGSIRALVEAREAGKTKWLGVSGHANPQAVEMALEWFDFDATLLAINPGDSKKLPFEKTCYRKACDAGLGIVNMKTLGGSGKMVEGRGGVFTAEALLRYAWSLRGHSTIVGMSSFEEIEYAVAAARRFAPITREEKLAMEKKAAELTTDACVGFRSLRDW